MYYYLQQQLILLRNYQANLSVSHQRSILYHLDQVPFIHTGFKEASLSLFDFKAFNL